MSGLDALELEVDTPSKMTILDPRTNLPLRDIEGNEAYIEVYSSDSQIARKFKRAIKTSRMRVRNPNSLTGEKLENEDAELLAELTTGWYLVDPGTGARIDLPYSRENARKLYGNHKLAWLYDQVDAHAGNRANFFKAASTT